MLQGRYLGSQKLQTSDRCCQMQGKIPFNVNKTRSQRSVTACSLRGRIYSQRSQPHHMLDRSSACQAMLCALSESSSIPQDQCCVSCRQLQHPSGPGIVSCCCAGPEQSLSLWHLHNLDKAHKHLLLPMSVPASSNLPCIPWALIHWHGSTS